jgi:hypothetical protein
MDIWVKQISDKTIELKNLQIESSWRDGCGRIRYLEYPIAIIETDGIIILPRYLDCVTINASDPEFFEKLTAMLKLRIHELSK